MIKINRPTCPKPKSLINKNYRDPENKKVLIDASYGKCMYCEAYIRSTSFGDIEHIKPKSKFPELEFEWNNLGFCCQRCNNNKLNKYNENIAPINPYDEDPVSFLFAQGAYIWHLEDNLRGEKTIKDINLNRKELLEKRLEAVSRIKNILKICENVPEPQKSDLINELKKDCAGDKEFSFILSSIIIF